MKKLLIAVSVVAAVGLSGAVNAASTGTITFNGKLIANTCEANVNGQGPDATVILPTIGTNQLVTKTQTTGRTAFTVSLSNCTGTLNTASVFFEAGPTVSPVGRLKNSGTATNVSLQLRDGSDAAQAPIQAGNTNQITKTKALDVSDGSAILPYAVEYYADGATTAGTVVSSVVYSIQYY